MDLLSWLSWGALLFSFGLAGGSLAVSFRSSEARTASRGMWLCLGGVLVLGVLGVATYLLGISIAFGTVASADASEKTARLAQGLSVAMNCTAFVVLGTLPVGLGALVLFARARRLARASHGRRVDPLQ